MLLHALLGGGGGGGGGGSSFLFLPFSFCHCLLSLFPTFSLSASFYISCILPEQEKEEQNSHYLLSLWHCCSMPAWTSEKSIGRLLLFFFLLLGVVFHAVGKGGRAASWPVLCVCQLASLATVQISERTISLCYSRLCSCCVGRPVKCHRVLSCMSPGLCTLSAP